MTDLTHPVEAPAFTEAEVERARQEIYDENCIEWYLGRTGTSRYDHESDSDGYIIRRVDLALTALQIDPTSWLDCFTRTTHPWNDKERFLEEEKDAIRRNPMPLGKYLVRRAIAELPIESDEDGDTSVDVVLALTDGSEVLFHAYGSYWTDYLYKTIPTDDARSMDELTLDGIEPDESSVEFTIDAELRLTPHN